MTALTTTPSHINRMLMHEVFIGPPRLGPPEVVTPSRPNNAFMRVNRTPPHPDSDDHAVISLTLGMVRAEEFHDAVTIDMRQAPASGHLIVQFSDAGLGLKNPQSHSQTLHALLITGPFIQLAHRSEHVSFRDLRRDLGKWLGENDGSMSQAFRSYRIG